MKTRNKVLIMGSNDEIIESMKNNMSKFIEHDLIATSTQIPIEPDAYSSLNCKLLLGQLLCDECNSNVLP
jgi:hypothetical protein